MRFSIKIYYILFGLILLSSIVVSYEYDNTSKRLGYTKENGVIYFDEYQIYSIAKIFPQNENKHSPNSISLSQKQAEDIANRNIIEILFDVNVDDTYKISDMIDKYNDDFNYELLKSSRGTRLLGVSYLVKNGVQVDMMLNLLTENGIYKIVYEKYSAELIDVFNKDFPVLDHFYIGTNFTSLIIDARDIDIEPAFFPSIYSDAGHLIFSVFFAEKEHILKNGVATYIPDMKSAENHIRVGDNPYRVIAWNAKGLNKSDIVISDEDAMIIVNDDELKKALKEGRLFVVTK